MKNRQYIRQLCLAHLYKKAECCDMHLADFSNRFQKIPESLELDFLNRLVKGNWPVSYVDKALYLEYYSRFRRFAEAGYARKLTGYRNIAEFRVMESIKRNLSHFSGHKVQAVTEELKSLVKLGRKDYLEKGLQVMKRHNRNYLEAELQTALAAANSAEKWPEIQRRAFLYPNLKYETVGDERVRESHQELDGLVYPVNHSFWDTYMPPNGFRCRCIVIQTDEQVNEAGELGFEPMKGFRNNPGKTGKLFEDGHPYFMVKKSWKGTIRQQSEEHRASWERKEVANIAYELVGKNFLFPKMPKPVTFDSRKIKAVLGAPHAEPALRNDLLTAIALIIPELSLYKQDVDRYQYAIELLGVQFLIQLVEENDKAVFDIII